MKVCKHQTDENTLFRPMACTNVVLTINPFATRHTPICLEDYCMLIIHYPYNHETKFFQDFLAILWKSRRNVSLLQVVVNISRTIAFTIITHTERVNVSHGESLTHGILLIPKPYWIFRFKISRKSYIYKYINNNVYINK